MLWPPGPWGENEVSEREHTDKTSTPTGQPDSKGVQTAAVSPEPEAASVLHVHSQPSEQTLRAEHTESTQKLVPELVDQDKHFQGRDRRPGG